jgi:hypothetical protein
MKTEAQQILEEAGMLSASEAVKLDKNAYKEISKLDNVGYFVGSEGEDTVKEAIDVISSMMLPKANSKTGNLRPFGNRQIDKVDASHNWPIGLILSVKKAFAEWYKANYMDMGNAANSRMDRLLRTRDSSGKATARKF